MDSDTNSTSAAQAASDSVIENELLNLGIVSLDGLDGMDFVRAQKVAQFSVPMSMRHYQAAINAGII